MTARPWHDCRVRNIDDGFRADCNCGWRSDLHPDSSTAWSHAQDHVVWSMNPPDFAVAFAERREAEINASLMTRDEWLRDWQPEPDLVEQQRRVLAAEQAARGVHVKDRGSDVCLACHEAWPCQG